MKNIILSTLLSFISVTVFSQAILPTSWSFSPASLPVGWTESGTNFYTASGNTPPAAMKFDGTGDYLIIHFNSNPGDLTYYLTGNGFSGGTFSVEQSTSGIVWYPLRTHTNPPVATYSMFTDTPQDSTRFIRFIYTNKDVGNIGLDDVSIAVGAATAAQEINIKNGTTTIVSGGTHVISSPVSVSNTTTFTIENLGTVNDLNISTVSLSGTHASDFSIFPLTNAIINASSDSTFVLSFIPTSSGTRNAILTIESDDADEPSYVINLYGVGGNLASEPAVQATNLGFSGVTSYSINADFNPASSAEGYIVLRKKGTPITAQPLDGISYVRGDIIGDAQVVFSGDLTSFTPNNIIGNQNYYFSVFSYNGPDGYRNYNISSPLSGNITTPITMMTANYYSSLNTSSSAFMDDLHNLVNPHQQQYYSNYDDLMIPFFEARDTTQDRRVVTCVYSGENLVYSAPFDFTANGYSREHTYCHSWMPTNPATNRPEYSDFHHLFPSNLNSANILRSNNPLGEVVNATSTFLGCKSGTNSSGQTVFEPRDEHKGNAARAIMYQAICYNSIDGNNWAIPSSQDQMILKQWHFQDPPDNWEISRNDYIESLQNNRNPFVDSVDYACFVNFSNMSYDPLACEVSSTSNQLNNKFITYPNPSVDILNLHVDGAKIVSYKIVDYLGRKVLSNSVNSKLLVKVDISKLKAGLYNVIVKTSLGKAQQTFVVQ